MKSIILLAVSILFSINLPAQQLVPITYYDAAQKLNGLVTSNKANHLPGVLILPAWKGIDDESKTAALVLEKNGYIAFIADIYGEGNIPADNNAASKIAGYYKNNFVAYQQRIALALEQIKNLGADSNRLAVIGYCFGGTGALEAARANLSVQGVVSIHGGLGKDSSRPTTTILPKVLVENPAEDRGVTAEIMHQFINEMKASKADWQIITYANSKHTFTNPASADYNETMANRAWQHTLLFLKEVLKN